MKRLRYNVAISLDGFIGRPGGEFDWIIGDPTIDFAALKEGEGKDIWLFGGGEFGPVLASCEGGPACLMTVGDAAAALASRRSVGSS